MSKRRAEESSGNPAPRRRDVLGAALAGAALLGCGKKKDPTRISKPPLRNSRGWRAGEERWMLSTCTLCEAGCGIKVRVVEGRAVKVEGNPEHPANRGGLCSRGQASLQLLYGADRLRSPLRRVGARGAGQWQPLSWDQALAELAGKLSALRAAGHPERLVMIDGQPNGFVPELWARWLGAYGSRNHVSLVSPSLAGMDLAGRYAGQGSPAYDVESARLVVLLGEEGLGASGQAMRLWQAASARKGAQGERALRVVCVSPRRPEARVDEWIPILPGGYGALALSLAHVLLRDGLIDKEFVEAHVTDHLAGRVQGLSEAQQKRFERSGLKWVQADFSPGMTEAATGIAPATVERLARELHRQAPAVVMGTAGVAGASNGLASAMAVILANALLGNVGKEGGLLWQQRPTLAAWSDESPDAVAAQGLQHPRVDGVGSEACPLGEHRVQALPEPIGQDKPHPVEILLVRRTDPLTTLPGHKGWLSALHKVPYLVSFSSRLDHTTMLADLVLPEHTALETWDVLELASASGEPILGMCQPVVAPVHDTRPAGALVIDLADKVGGAVRKAVPWPTYEDAVKERLQGLAQAENNEYVATLMASMKDKGGWWREQDDERPMAAPGEIGVASLGVFSRFQKQGIGDHAERQFTAWPIEGMPPWEPARYAGSSKEFPFLLYVYRPASLIHEGMESCPWLSEVPLVAGSPSGSVVQIHPDDAHLANVDDGDEVTVESTAGKCTATVRVISGIRPGVLAMALGASQAIDLLVVGEDRLTGLLAWQGTRVRMRASQ